MSSFGWRPRPTPPVARDEPACEQAAPGEDNEVRAIVDCGVYIEGVRAPGTYSPARALAKVHDLQRDGTAAFVWIGLHEPDLHEMHAVANVFGLHPLAVEDAVCAQQRPKL